MSRKRREKKQVREAWGDFVDPLGYINDDPAFGHYTTRGGQPGDRGEGRNPPSVTTEQDLASIRSAARLLASGSGIGVGIVESLTSYVVSTGFGYEVVPTAGMEPPAGLLAELQGVVFRFLDDNDWIGDLEAELFRRRERDGESFLALYRSRGGDVQARCIEPEWITEPQNPREAEEFIGWDEMSEPSSWSFGIHTPLSDIQRTFGYWTVWQGNPTDFEYLPVASGSGDCWGVEHDKANVDRNIKRGLSSFYPVQERLTDTDKSIRNISKALGVLSAIAMIREHAPGVTQSQITSMRSGAMWSYANQTMPSGTNRTRYAHRYEPGTIVDVPNQQKYVAGPLATAGVGDSFPKLCQTILRAGIGVRWSMPEYLISGDASGTSYSSAMVAESPFVKKCEREQAHYKMRWGRVMWKVIRIAYEANRFRRYGVTYEDLLRLFNVEIKAPRVAARDHGKETAIKQIHSQAGILSRRTWAAEEGYNLDQEERLGAKPSTDATQVLGAQGENQVTVGTTAGAEFKDTGAQAVKDANAGQPKPAKESREDRMRKAAGMLFESYP